MHGMTHINLLYLFIFFLWSLFFSCGNQILMYVSHSLSMLRALPISSGLMNSTDCDVPLAAGDHKRIMGFLHYVAAVPFLTVKQYSNFKKQETKQRKRREEELRQ